MLGKIRQAELSAGRLGTLVLFFDSNGHHHSHLPSDVRLQKVVC